MSDAPTKTGQRTGTPPVQRTETPPVQQSPTSRPRRFLNALGRGAASVKRRGERTGTSLGETLENASNFINYVLLETDYDRRRARFDGLKDEITDDARLTEALAKAERWTKQIDKHVKDPKSTWTIRATACTLATEDLLADIKLARQNEADAQNAYPGIHTQLDRVSDALENAKLQLTPTQHQAFGKDLNALQLELIKLGPTKPGKNAPEPPLAGKAVALGERIVQAVNDNAERQNQLRLKLAPLQTRLAAASGGTGESDGGDKRLAVSQLLTEADNALFAFDFTVAETAMQSATTALNEMKAPMPEDLPDPQDLLNGILVVRKQATGISKRASKLPSPVSGELVERVNGVVTRLATMEYALGKSGGSTIADVNRITEASVEELIGIDQAITDYAEFESSRGDADTAFAKMLRRVQGQAQSYYQKLGMTEGGDGAFQTRLKGIQERWTTALSTSISMAELDLDNYINELEELSAEMLSTKGNPQEIAVEKAASRFKAALEDLESEADRLIGVDSDRALKLGLTTRPATLRKGGEALLSPKSTSLDPEDRVRQLDAVTLQMTTLATEAKRFDDKTALAEANLLRQHCETQAAEVRRRIEKVLLAIDIERKKTVSIGTNKTERDGLTTYGTALLADLMTILAPLGGLKSKEPLDAGLLNDAVHDLSGLAKRVTDFEAMSPGGKSDKTIPSFESLGKRAEKLTTTLTTSTLFTVRPELTEPWTTALEAITSSMTGRDPRKTDVELRTIEAAVKLAKVAAKKESKEADLKAVELRNLAADVTLGKGGLSALATMPVYRKDLEFRLLKMADDIEKADKVDPLAAKLILEVSKAGAQGTAGTQARTAGNATALETQKTYDAAKAALTHVLEVELELLEETAGKLKGAARKELFKQAKDLRSQTSAALQALELTRDSAAATTLADALKERIARIADAPLGSSTRSRNQLGTVEKRWIKAVEILHRDLDLIPGVVKPVCAGDTTAETAADAVAAKLVEPVKSLFRADAFSAVMKRIAVADDQGLLDAREDALREIRRLTAMMGSDSRIHLLSKVPFPGAVTPFPEIGNALWDLETNLMTSG